MNGTIFCVCSILAISVLQFVLKWCRKERKKIQEKRVTAKSKTMMNLVSRCSERNPEVLASVHQKSKGETRNESQMPLSSWNEQQARTDRLVMDASWSNYSEWHIDEKWSSQDWKSDECRSKNETCEWTTSRFVHSAHRQVCHHHSSQNETFRQKHDHSCTTWMIEFERCWTNPHSCNTRKQPTCFNMGRVYLFNSGSIFDWLGKNYSETLHSSKIQGTISQWNRC